MNNKENKITHDQAQMLDNCNNKRTYYQIYGKN